MSKQAVDPRARRFESVLETIGGTPLIRIRKLAPPHVNLYAKVESFNPMGSVKDRLALGIIEDAERSGRLKPGQTVIEATSGNTGIGLAMVCAAKGYPLVVVMAESFSVERRKLMRFLGAKVVLTPASLKGSGMVAKATELAEKHGWFLCRQFENEANAEMHSRTTAPEILAAMQGEKIDYFVTGYGTGGTLKGVARVLKQQQPGIQIIACEPDNSQILGSGIAQARNADGSPAASHALFRPHAMQGWTPDFIPQLTEDAVNDKYIDRVLPINGNDALRLSRDLARREGIFVGITAGATLAGALRVAIDAPKGANIVCMLPDTGERYLSTPLFGEISADMTEEEQLISRSTPNFRFDVSAAPAPAAALAAASSTPSPEVTSDVREFVDGAINDGKQPVVMFALEWCEFCWAVRKMFAKLGVAYRSIDVDSVEYQKNNRGGNIRTALANRTHVVTIPQIFVGGEFIGGCTDTFDAYKNRNLQALFDKAGVQFDRELKLDPNSLLPGWLHPR